MTVYITYCFNGHKKVEADGETYDFGPGIIVSDEFLCEFLHVDSVYIVNEW